MMGHKTKLNGAERDVVSRRWRRWLAWCGQAGACRKVKRQILRRERREVRTMLGVVYRNGEAYTS